MSDGDWREAAKTDELKPDEPIRVIIDSEDIALFQIDEAYFATGDICTHAYASLSDGFQEGEEVECPLHEGRFNIKTGEALCAPVTDAIQTYETKLEGDTIFVKMDSTAPEQAVEQSEASEA